MPGFLLRKTYASLSALLNNSFYVLFHGHFNKTLIQTNVLLIPLFVEGNSSRAACITKLHYFVVIDSYPAFNSECKRWSFDPWKTVQTSQETSRYYLLNLSVFSFEPKKLLLLYATVVTVNIYALWNAQIGTSWFSQSIGELEMKLCLILTLMAPRFLSCNS